MWKYEDIMRDVVIEYSLTETYLDDGQFTYGVKADMYINGEPADHSCVYDAFCTRSKATSFIMLLAENGVEPCHLEEVIIDELTC